VACPKRADPFVVGHLPHTEATRHGRRDAGIRQQYRTPAATHKCRDDSPLSPALETDDQAKAKTPAANLKALTQLRAACLPGPSGRHEVRR
jgi:hypothetical protein